LPRFDLVLLGLGTDGHTASLFPGTAALHQTKRLVVTNWTKGLDADRVTMTIPVLNSAARVIFLVSGKEKASALGVVLEGEYRPNTYPAQAIRPRKGTILWLIDKNAGRLLH
jgi:6-phosphogluconolactonase